MLGGEPESQNNSVNDMDSRSFPLGVCIIVLLTRVHYLLAGKTDARVHGHERALFG